MVNQDWKQIPCLDHGRAGNKDGYAVTTFRVNGVPKSVRLHRMIFLQAHGYLPPVVMHRCDNTRCIEIAHLKGGTQKMNNEDRAAKGRSVRFRPNLRRLSANEVREIRKRYAARHNRDPINGPAALASDYGVSRRTIHTIVNGGTYRDVA